MPAYRLITLGPSHYCEKARWALSRCRVPFVEEPHVPLIHSVHTRKAGGTRTVPVLLTDSGTFADSTDILELCDRQTSGALYGSGETRRQSRDLEEYFDEKLGPHTRRLVYFHILDEKPLVVGLFVPGVSRAERASFEFGYYGIRALMRKGMKINREGADRSRERALAVFRDVSARLGDGRRYLTGDRFTAADLTFASLAAPVILPPEYGWPLPPLASLGPAMQSEVRHFRDSAAGELVLRLYREDRAQVLAVGS
ncbi:MAG: glutathione S-transferase [Polyangiaceae bacterium]|nr:glutathione S-transferase [Polyangiaceae bacterium]